jgi:hypothetical protein
MKGEIDLLFSLITMIKLYDAYKVLSDTFKETNQMAIKYFPPVPTVSLIRNIKIGI